MKPVLREVIDKNGGSEMVFSPTARMILFSVFKSEGLSDVEACVKASIDPQLPAKWRTKYGSYFIDWLEESIDQGVGADDAKVLERVGMVNALQGNFQFWREMARTKGVIKDEEPKKGITINTDFTVVMQMAGGDLHAAREQLLKAARGLAEPGGFGMALPSSIGEPTSTGDRAGELQGKPLEMANALGSNRGRTEQRTTFSTVSEQNPFAGTYRVLDEGEVSSSTQIPPDDSDMAF